MVKITNDTTTLNGALTELGELMADNLVTQGVTGASASDGLTTLANKILNIQTGGGGSCYHIEFINSSYIAIDGVATVSVYLQSNYAPLSGATVTFTSSTSTSTTATTDSNGIATATITFSASTTLTATYSNVSDTATITKQSYYFLDDASVDNSSLYTSYSLRASTGSETITWKNTESAYLCARNTNGYALLQFGDTVLHNNMKISADIKLYGSSWANNGILGFADATNPNTYCMGGWVQGQKYYRICEFNGNSELQTTQNTTWSSVSTSDYNHHELTYVDGVVTYTLTTPSSATKTISLTLQQSNYIGGKVGLFVECATGSHCYIKNIKAEPIS